MKKALNIVKNILVWLVVVFAVLMMVFTVVSVNTFDRSDRSLFGYRKSCGAVVGKTHAENS